MDVTLPAHLTKQVEQELADGHDRSRDELIEQAVRHLNPSTSPTQIEANRVNARRSTGPVTEEGKAHASQGARVHEPCSRQLHLADEEEAAIFASLRGALSSDLAPVVKMPSRRRSSKPRVSAASYRPRFASKSPSKKLASRPPSSSLTTARPPHPPGGHPRS